MPDKAKYFCPLKSIVPIIPIGLVQIAVVHEIIQCPEMVSNLNMPTSLR